LEREAVGKVMAVPAHMLGCATLPMDQDAKTVALDFVNPAGSGSAARGGQCSKRCCGCSARNRRRSSFVADIEGQIGFHPGGVERRRREAVQ
jgi:hypothetical protein